MEQLCKHCKKPITEDDRRWVCRNEHCPTQYCEDCCDKREFWDNKDYCEHCDDGKKADYDKVLYEDEMAKDDDESDDGFEDCEWCGYTHHYEDKCPIGKQCERYEQWRKDTEEEDTEEE